MKKSKIIVPALGILAFSTAAAVTGTVAWFTANRTATVTNSQITVVNPEAGLNLVRVANVANTVITGVDGSGKPTSANTVGVTHANDGTSQGYLRDASVDLSGTPVVYKSVLGDDGSRTGYAEQTITAKDTKKFDNKDIYFATAFSLDFKVPRLDAGYNSCLFFDANASYTDTLASVKVGDVADTNLVYKSLRIGMKCGSEWFIWAPLTSDANVKYIHNSTVAPADPSLGEETAAAANFIKGNATAATTDSKFIDTNPLVKLTAEGYVEYLGVLNDSSATTVTVYTWFEGTDSACVNDNFQAAAANFTANLKFITRKVLKS